MADHAPIPFEIAKLQAAQVLERMIAGKPLGHKGEGGQFIQNPKVSISTALGVSHGEIGDTESVRIELSGTDVSEHMVGSREIVESVLKEFSGLKAHIKFGDDDQEATTTRTLVSDLINQGVEIPKEVLKWAGFSHENNEGKSWWHESKNTTTTTVDSHGVMVSFNLPDHLPNSLTQNSIKENFESRKEAILDMLAERIAKYRDVRGNKEEVAKIRAALGDLEMEVFSSGTQVRDDKVVTGDFKIIFRSKQQKAAKDAHDKEHPNDPVGVDPALASSNILETLQAQELSKAINRTMLTAGEGAMDMAMNIAGSKDIYRLLEKALTHAKHEKPELAEKMNEVLASTLFEDDSCRKAKSDQHETKEHLMYQVADSSTLNKIIVDIPLPKDEAGKFIREVAAMGGHQALDFGQFTSIDNVQLIGIHSPIPALHHQLQHIVAPFAGQQMDAPNMDVFAQNIVHLIEQAHAQVALAKQTFASMPAEQLQQQVQQQPTQPAPLQNSVDAAVQAAKQVEQQMAPTPQVTPSSIAVNQSPAIDFNNPNWARKLAAFAGRPADGVGMGA